MMIYIMIIKKLSVDILAFVVILPALSVGINNNKYEIQLVPTFLFYALKITAFDKFQIYNCYNMNN